MFHNSISILGCFTLSKTYPVINTVSADAKGSHVFTFLCVYQLILNIEFPFILLLMFLHINGN